MLRRTTCYLRSEWGTALSLLFALLAAEPLLQSGFLNTRGGGDSPFLLFRLHQLYAALTDGVFPVRWMPDAAFGLGYPFFSYYAALPYYVAALFRWLGASYVLSLKLTQVLGFLLAGGGAYGWMRRVSGRQGAALLASTAYTFAPFHLVNIYVRGDSLSEFWAMAWYPLILWAVHLAAEHPTARRLAILGLSYGGLIATHNVSAMIFLPTVALYALVLAWQQRSSRTLVRLLAGLGLGLVISAWFWVPALGEQSFAQLGEQTTGYFFYGNHFRAGDLIQPTFLFDYTIGEPSQTPFSMGLVQALLIVLGVAAIIRLRSWSRDGAVLVNLALATVMITSLSRPLWDGMPLLPFTQFPWRFLSVQAIFGAAVTGALAEVFPRRWGRLTAVAGSLLVLTVGLGALRLNFIPLTDADVTAERLQWYEAFSGNIGTTIRHEYLPVWTNPRPYASDALLGDPSRARFLEGQGSGAQMAAHAAEQTWQVQVTSERARIVLPLLYWPGWRSWSDGQPVELNAAQGLGYAELELLQGTHDVILQLRRTPLRLAAEWVSLAAAVLTLLLSRPRPTWGWLVLPGTLLALFTAFHILPSSPALPQFETLNADFDQEAFFHPSPDGIWFADGSRLLGYEIISMNPLRIQMIWGPATDAQIVLTLAPPPPLERIGAPAGGVISGLCMPRLTLVDSATGELIPALTTNGQPRGEIYLRPIVVHATLSGDVPASLAQLGPLTLQHLGTTYTNGALVVSPLWQTEVPLPQNYAIALRLRDVADWEWAALDVQVGGAGLYPTALWPTGEMIPDGYRLDLTPGAPPSSQYSLTLTLYDPTTLAPLGSHELAGVALPATPADPNLSTLAHWPTEGLSVADITVPQQITQGDPLWAEVLWITTASPDQTYRIRWSLGASWAAETPLATGSDPHTWDTGILVRGINTLHPPGALSPGAYTLTLQLLDETGAPVGEELAAGLVTVVARDRLFEEPPLEVTREVLFGDSLRLLGYTLTQADETLSLTLAWGAAANPDRDFMYFVHVLDPTTEHIVAQIDTMPRAYTYPTSRWVAGEVVVEEITLDLSNTPPGVYHIALGWYDPASLDRLVAVEDGERCPADRVVLTEQVTLSAP